MVDGVVGYIHAPMAIVSAPINTGNTKVKVTSRHFSRISRSDSEQLITAPAHTGERGRWLVLLLSDLQTMWGLALLALLKLFFDVYYFIWTLVCIVKSYCLLHFCGGRLDLFSTLKTWGEYARPIHEWGLLIFLLLEVRLKPIGLHLARLV